MAAAHPFVLWQKCRFKNPNACLGLSEVLTFSLPLQLLTTLLLHWIKVSDLSWDALTWDVCLIPAWKAAQVEIGSTTHPCTKAEASAGWKKALLLYIGLQAQFEHQSSHILWYRILSLLKSHYIFVVTSSHCGIMCGVNDTAMVIKCPYDDLKQKQFSSLKSFITSTYFYDGLLIQLLNIYCFLNKSNLRCIQLLI